jgi:hypothetical protein
MLGVAIPGIAPTAPGSNAPVPPAGPSGGPARIEVQNENRTMLGVPAVGEAPPPQPATYTTTGIPVLPAPPPLQLEALPAAPRKAERRGVPLGVVAGSLAALLCGIGIAVLVLLKGGSPLVVQPRLSPKGTDVLHLNCDSCPDGTHASTGGSSADFKNKEADLELATPLAVGDNALVLHLDRPGSGRDEDVKAPVPIRYRIRTDLTGVAEATPLVKVVVEAETGATVKLDGKPLTLDATGKGWMPIDLTSETQGMADETKTIDRTIPYEVTLKDHVERGSVSARVAVPALRIDAPLAKTVIGTDRFYVAGRTIKGAQVTVNGRPVNVDANTGVFAEPFGAPTVTELPIEVRATLPQSAARTVALKIRRSDQLEAQARAADKAAPTSSYNELAANTSTFVGKPRAVEGDLVELRTTNYQSILLIRDKRSCDRPDGNCLVRVLHGAAVDARPGAKMLAVGRVSRAFTAGGNTVPEVEAEIVVPVGRGK